MKLLAFIVLLQYGLMARAAGEDSSCKRLEHLSYVYAELKGFNDAGKYIDSLAVCSATPVTGYTKANLLFKNNQFRAALEAFEQYINSDDGNTEQTAQAYNYAGICAHKIKNYEKALQHYRQAEKLGFSKSVVYYNMGIIYVDMASYTTAIDYYKKSLNENNKNASAWNNLGVAYEKEQLDYKAVGYYATAYTLNKGSDPLLMVNYAKSLKFNNKQDSALIILNEALNIHPEYYDADIEAAKLYNFYFKIPKQAYVHARKAVLAAPDNSHANFELAVALSDLGHKDSALYYYSLVTYLRPTEPAAYTNMGTIYRLYGYFEKAIESNEKALEINPLFQDAIRNLANTYMYKYDFTNALKYALKNYEIHTNRPEKSLGLGYAYLLAGYYDKAIPYLKEAMINRTEHLDIPLNNMGLAFLKMDKLDSGKFYIDAAFKINPGNSFIYHNRALYYYKTDNYDAACADLKKALELEYNWIIDSALQKITKEYCKDISLNRIINYHGYKGYSPEFANKKFIELIDSLSLNHFETTLKPITDSANVITQPRTETPVQTSGFSIYPNPTTGNITITQPAFEEGKIMLDVYNSNGQKVFIKEIYGNSDVNLSSLPGGLYVAVILQNNNVVHTEKIIKQ
ncbi:MAG TPA: tetratricopeptide repeat protein [Bacteroidia bacterium]|nr:tetratricopeptide repeat protein [Bacteroidia bacterium]